jgi:hypothetical protein
MMAPDATGARRFPASARGIGQGAGMA